jgi:hypothetical protein
MTNSCTGATLFSKQNNVGGTLGWDFTTVPASDECVDLTNVFGDFVDKTRSITVAWGRECWFYV